MNNQGKTNKQYEDSAKFTGYSIISMIILIIFLTLSSCTGVYYLTDAEYSDAREDHASLTYYNNSIYWGWNSGYYYYYGKPHYYPWHYYYNTCPPSYYNTTTHVIINRPVKKPTHRPNIRVKTNTHRNTKVKINTNRNRVNVKTNRSNNSNKTRVKTHRKPR
tara:strand:+ start:137 stop:622 length:486 start_codon:yes stop_codon:yes gene_type:complete